MKAIQKRILAILLSAAMLLGTLLLVSCNTTGDGQVTTAPQGPTDTTVPVGDEEREPTREDEEPNSLNDYSGRTLNILARKGPYGSPLLEGKGNDVQSISDAIAKRTLYLEEKYKITLTIEEVGDKEDFPKLQASYLGGEQKYDFIAPHPTINMTPLLTSGMLEDLDDSAAFGGHIDLTKLWWNQSQVEAFTVNGRLFVGAPDFSLNKRGLGALVLNKDTWDTVYQDEDIYSIVFDGKWTLDKMVDVVNDNYDEEAKEYGYAGTVGSPSSFYMASGEVLLVKDENGRWVHKLDVEKCSTLAQKLYNLVIGPQALLEDYHFNTYPTSQVWKAFSEGKVLLHPLDIDFFGKMLASVEFKTAYLPYPKLNEDQDRYYGSGGTGFMGIPNDAKDLELCGLVMETANWWTYHNFRPVYYESYLSVMVSKNENDRRIIEMIVKNAVFDFGSILDSTGIEPGKAAGMWQYVIVENLSTDVASYIEEWEEVNNEKFQEILKEIY